MVSQVVYLSASLVDVFEDGLIHALELMMKEGIKVTFVWVIVEGDASTDLSRLPDSQSKIAHCARYVTNEQCGFLSDKFDPLGAWFIAYTCTAG